MNKVLVLAVDGVGHPKAIEIETALILPIRVVVKIEEKNGLTFEMPFYRSGEEMDSYGRPVYRQKCSGPAPKIRYRLLAPRTVGSTGE